MLHPCGQPERLGARLVGLGVDPPKIEARTVKLTAAKQHVRKIQRQHEVARLGLEGCRQHALSFGEQIGEYNDRLGPGATVRDAAAAYLDDNGLSGAARRRGILAA